LAAYRTLATLLEMTRCKTRQSIHDTAKIPS
jgi:hypothetical protein